MKMAYYLVSYVYETDDRTGVVGLAKTRSEADSMASRWLTENGLDGPDDQPLFSFYAEKIVPSSIARRSRIHGIFPHPE